MEVIQVHTYILLKDEEKCKTRNNPFSKDFLHILLLAIAFGFYSIIYDHLIFRNNDLKYW